MCFGALIHARIERVIFAARTEQGFWCQLQLPEAPCYNHQLTVTGGLYADESAALLQQFFQARRSAPSQKPD